MTARPRPVRRVERHPDATFDASAWPDSIPAVTHLLTRGLDLPPGVTFLVGENGAGKSTLVEGIADALGVHVEGGTTHHLAGTARGDRTDRSDLGPRLRIVRSPGGGRQAFFLRAETVHRFYDYLEGDPEEGEPRTPGAYHVRSHGEGVTDLVASRYVREAQVVLLDEPESALSFSTCLALAGSLRRMAADGKQVLCATHSPLLTALPGAHVLQVDERGLTYVEWEDLAVVRDWRFFLDAPERYWRDVL